MKELTDEQLDIKEAKQAREMLLNNIKMGKNLEKLKKLPEFKELILDMFIENGKSILWDNIKYLSEEQLRGRGSDRNEELIEAMKGQVKARLDLEGFMDTVESDYIMALEEQNEAKED